MGRPRDMSKEACESKGCCSSKAKPPLDRKQKLRELFRHFDLDAGGHVCDEEILELGQARRALGQKDGEWTPAKAQDMVNLMDPDHVGYIEEEEFVHYFHRKF